MDQFPTFELTDRVALVTGAARGLGRAISRALAHAGAHVALGLRDRNADAGLPDEIAKLDRQALPLQMDVANLPQIRDAIDATVATNVFLMNLSIVTGPGVSPSLLLTPPVRFTPRRCSPVHDLLASSNVLRTFRSGVDEVPEPAPICATIS